eukprot:m51a1_g8826 putative 3-hydroxy-3-methylglutaryl-CoA reductase (383) ;mRNA; f:369992-371594
MATTSLISRDSIDDRRALLGAATSEAVPVTLGEEVVKNKIENYVGCIPYPLGLIGPVTLDGAHAKGEFVIPMATLEGTLLASYSRGCKLMVESAVELAVDALCYESTMSRMASFACSSLAVLGDLLQWCQKNEADISKTAEGTSRHLRVKKIEYEPMGLTLGVRLCCATGDAMGSNMVSNAALHVSRFISTSCGLDITIIPVPFPEDKKNTPLSRKGKKVIAHTVLSQGVLAKKARTTAEAMHAFFAYTSGMIGMHGGASQNVHAINGLAALYVALGQDVAYLGECSQSITVTTSVLPGGHLDVAVTFPSMIIATVGGGTGLPAFRALLGGLGCVGEGTSDRLAEIMAAGVLAGEVSCACAQCAFEFVSAHNRLGRNDPTKH